MSNVIEIKKLYSINFFDLSPSFNTTIHKHEDWELLYVDSGEFDCIVEGEKKLLKQGDVIFHQPLETHSTVCNGKKSASVFNIHFECHSEAMECFKKKILTVSQRTSEVLKKLISECNETYRVSFHPITFSDNVPFGGEQMVLLLLEEFLILLARDSQNIVNPIKSRNSQPYVEPMIEDICAYLKANVYGKVTLDDLTEKFHFSKSFIFKQFKNHIGLSPISYYLDLKLIEAKRLLREDGITITEIAERLGFESPEYLSRYFKKRVGHSPREFRNMLINHASLKKK